MGTPSRVRRPGLDGAEARAEPSRAPRRPHRHTPSPVSRLTTITRALTGPLLAVPLLAGACGGEPPDPRAAEVIRTIQDFATADGEEACELLTEAALERLYGGLEGCLKRSEDFKRGAVKVEKVEIDDRGTRATAQARSLGGEDRFTVVARLVAPPGCPYPCPQAQWRISEVRPQ